MYLLSVSRPPFVGGRSYEILEPLFTAYRLDISLPFRVSSTSLIIIII